jgi:hypothetical protein
MSNRDTGHIAAPSSAARWQRRALTTLAIAVSVGCLSGCSVWRHARRTLITEPSEYSWKHDRARSLKAYRQWADEAWAAESGSCPEVAGDDDYALGFKDGFVDLVYAGGDGQPPPVPPRQFWNVAWRNPPGNAAAANWFAGYRHGAYVAREGGYRENGIVPSSYRVSGGYSAEPYAPAGEPILAPQEMLPMPDGRAEFESDMLPAMPMPSSAPESAPIERAEPESTPEIPLADPPAAPPPTAQRSARPTGGSGEIPFPATVAGNAAATAAPVRQASAQGPAPKRSQPSTAVASESSSVQRRQQPSQQPQQSAVERFRRAVSPVPVVEPSAAP